MEWASRTGTTALIAMPQGRIDETSWEAFLEGLSGAIKQAESAGLPLILDLAGVAYMSSRGLRVLTIAKREAGERGVTLTLARPNHRITEILSISRYDKLFVVTQSLEA